MFTFGLKLIVNCFHCLYDTYQMCIALKWMSYVYNGTSVIPEIIMIIVSGFI